MSCLTLGNSMNCSTPGFPVLSYLPEFARTHIHWVSDVIQPSHSLSPPSPILTLSQHQGLFQRTSSSHQVAEVLELQHQSFQWIFRIDLFQDWLVWSPCCPRDSQSLHQHHSSTIFGNFLEKYHSFLWNLPTLFYFKPRPADIIRSVDPF